MNTQKIVHAIQEQIDLLDITDSKQCQQAETLLEAKNLVLAAGAKKYKIAELVKTDCFINCEHHHNLMWLVNKLNLPAEPLQERFGIVFPDSILRIVNGRYRTLQKYSGAIGIPTYDINDIDCDIC